MKIKNSTNKLRKFFSQPLKLISILNTINSLAAIPYGLLNAKMLSEIVSAAINGRVDTVINRSIFLICLVLGYNLLLSALGMLRSLKDMTSMQKCKIILYKHLLANPLDLMFQSTNGSILENLTDDLETVASAQKSVYPGFVVAVLTTIVYFIYIGKQSLIIAITLLLLSLLQMIAPIIIRKYLQSSYDLNRDVEAKITDLTVTGYKGMATIKLFSLNRWFLEKMKHLHSEAANAGRKAEMVGAAQASMSTLVGNLMKYGMYVVVGIIVYSQNTTLDVGIQAIAISGGLFGAVNSIFQNILQFSLIKKSEERLEKWFEKRNRLNVCTVDENYALYLENISYKYENNIVLNDLTLKLDLGEFALIKGRNGAGKTTLLRIITGLLVPQNGTVSFGVDDNTDLASFWGNILVYLPQEDITFDMTTIELCQMLKCKPSTKDFEEWGISSSSIESTNISDLSGGEKKKVYLAIAFCLNPNVLILDEPTNSLDKATKEILCHKLLNRLNTTLVISHDDCFDELNPNIYRLEDGEIRIERHN